MIKPPKSAKMPKKMMGHLSPAAASKIRMKASKMLSASDRVKPDPDSAAGAAT